MNKEVWIILVTYLIDEKSNVSQIGFAELEQARDFIRVYHENAKQLDDFTYCDNDIIYEIKCVSIKDFKNNA